MMGESAINPCENWIKQNPAISFAGLCLVKWCSGRDLNSHDLWSLPPQDSVSTNSTTRALIFMLILFYCGMSLFLLSFAGAACCC